MFVFSKRELNLKSSAKQKSDEDLRKCRRQVTNLTVELQRCRKEAKEKEDHVQLVEEDVKRYMAENGKLQDKLRVMQESISSPSGDPRNSAIARLLYESPAPMLRISNLADSPASTPPLNERKTFNPTESGLARANPFKKARLGSEDLVAVRPRLTDPEEDDRKGKELEKTSQKTTAAVLQLPEVVKTKRFKYETTSTTGTGSSASSGFFYDGMGGHSKPDVYPDPSARVRSTQDSSSQPSKSSSQRTIKMNIKGKLQTKTIDLYYTK